MNPRTAQPLSIPSTYTTTLKSATGCERFQVKKLTVMTSLFWTAKVPIASKKARKTTACRYRMACPVSSRLVRIFRDTETEEHALTPALSQRERGRECIPVLPFAERTPNPDSQTRSQGLSALSTSLPAFSPGPGGLTASFAFWMPLSIDAPAFSVGPLDSHPAKLTNAPTSSAARNVLGFFHCLLIRNPPRSCREIPKNRKARQAARRAQ